MGNTYEDRSTDVAVDPQEPSVTDGPAPEEDDDPLGWFVSLLIEANASDG